jgi:hypothetical protein
VADVTPSERRCDVVVALNTARQPSSYKSSQRRSLWAERLAPVLRYLNAMTHEFRAPGFEGSSDVLEELGKPHLLIVDHEPDVRAAMKQRLEAEGFTVGARRPTTATATPV